MVEYRKEDDIQKIEYGNDEIRHKISRNGKIYVQIYRNHCGSDNRHDENNRCGKEIRGVLRFFSCRAITASPQYRTYDKGNQPNGEPNKWIPRRNAKRIFHKVYDKAFRQHDTEDN